MSATIPQVISWPLDGIDEQGRFSYTTDDDSVREVIRNILLTRPGERLRRKTFGAGITDFIHQNNNLTTRTMLANVVRKAVQQWETRVIVEGVEVLPDKQRLTTVHITIRYRMRHTRRMNQLTLSLDLDQV
jgi:phage baseplate assembly protein W